MYYSQNIIFYRCNNVKLNTCYQKCHCFISKHLRSLPKFKERIGLKIKQWILIRTPASEEITQGKLILLSGRWLENSFCAVVISFCPCNYEVIWEASALTIRKCALVCLNRTRSLPIPCAPWHDCLMSTVFQKTCLFHNFPLGFETTNLNFLGLCGVFEEK